MAESIIAGLFPEDITAHEEHLDGVCKHLATYLSSRYNELGGIAQNLPPEAFPAEMFAILDKLKGNTLDPSPQYIMLQLMVRDLPRLALIELVGKAPQVALYATRDMEYAQAVGQCFAEPQ